MTWLNKRVPADRPSGITPVIPVWKRCLDLTLVILMVPAVLPISLIVAALIKIVSPGPVLFKQERVGFLGKRFMCFKFRTMKLHADTSVHKHHFRRLMSSDSPMTKLDSRDPRLIPFGLALRSLGIDELPQLLNVLRGEMSLVGPRPCIPYEFENFLPHHQRRCHTLPGLTGLWQVNGKNRTTFEQMMQFDLDYAENKTLLMDLRILAMTVPAILSQAYETKVRVKHGLGPMVQQRATPAVSSGPTD